MPNTKQNYRRMQAEKRGQEPIADRPEGCCVRLVPDPFSESADSRSIRVFGKNVCRIFAQRAEDSRNKREPRNETFAQFLRRRCLKVDEFMLVLVESWPDMTGQQSVSITRFRNPHNRG